MGNKQTIDPNSQSISNKQEPNRENAQFLAYISNAFRGCASNGVISKDQFYQVLSILEQQKFKRMRDTPLADQLFTVFNRSNSGYISEQQFIKGISDIISDKENAINYTFQAYDRDGDKFVSRKQFMIFIEESWKVSFRLLYESVKTKGVALTANDIQGWTRSKVPILNQTTSQLFNRFSNGNDKMDYLGFKQFILNGNCNEITAELNDTKISIPLNLTNIMM